MTDPTDSRPEAEPAAPPLEGADLARRRFFRQFAGDLFHGAAGVVGAAQAIQRVSAEAASAILDPSSVAIGGAAAAPVVPAPPTGFRTPFRETPGVLHLVDQRKLPDVLEEYRVRTASETAFAIREMIVRGAPAIGQECGRLLAQVERVVRVIRAGATHRVVRGLRALIRQRRLGARRHPQRARELLHPGGAVAEMMSAARVRQARDEELVDEVARRRVVVAATQGEKVTRIGQAGSKDHEAVEARLRSGPVGQGKRAGGERDGCESSHHGNPLPSWTTRLLPRRGRRAIPR